MKAAVTGASGFLGVNLVNALVDAGHDVLALDMNPSDHFPDAVRFEKADVLDADGMRRVFKGIDAVFHLVAVITLAQEEDEVAWRVNVEGVRVAAEAALACKVKRFVLCSSMHAFDQHVLDRDPEAHFDETSPRSERADLPVYDRSKYAGEVELRKVIEQGLDGVIGNPTGIVGPVDYANSRVNEVFLDAAKGRVPAMIEGGFDWVDVRDVADGLILAHAHGKTGENYILGGHRRSLFDTVKMAAEAVGRRGPAAEIPHKMVKPLMPMIEPIAELFGSDVMTSAALDAVIANPLISHEKATKELGYQPRPIEQTMRDLVAFFVSQGMLAKGAKAD